MAMETESSSGVSPFIEVDPPEHNISNDTIDLSIELESKPKTRTRSNSKIYGNSTSKTEAASKVPEPSLPPSNLLSAPFQSKEKTSIPSKNGIKNLNHGASYHATSENGNSINGNSINGNSKNGNLGNGSLNNGRRKNSFRLTENPEIRNKKVIAKKIASRNTFINLLILKSLNDTFERKTLKVPQFPEKLKLGRPNNSQRAPNVFNGYFDSRVISREHAELYIQNGKLFINDLESANGTFVNNSKIISETELNKDDIIDLGIDIDSENVKHQHHRKISCQIEDFLTIPVDGEVSTSELLKRMAKLNNATPAEDLPPFEAAMFGDVSHDLEDTALGISHDFISGVSALGNIGTSSSVTQTTRILMNQLHEEKVNNLKLSSIEMFLIDYQKQLSQDNVTLRLTKLNSENEQYRAEIKLLNSRLSELNSNSENLVRSYENSLKEKDKELNNLKSLFTEERVAKNGLLQSIEELNSQLRIGKEHISSLQSDMIETREIQDSEIEELTNQIKAKTKEIENLTSSRDTEIVNQKKLDAVQDFHNAVLTNVIVCLLGLSLLLLT